MADKSSCMVYDTKGSVNIGQRPISRTTRVINTIYCNAKYSTRSKCLVRYRFLHQIWRKMDIFRQTIPNANLLKTP